MTKKITLDGKVYNLDIDKAKALGILTEPYKLVVGGIYTDPKGRRNDLTLVKCFYSDDTLDEGKRAYQLLGLKSGTAPNSDPFYKQLHTLDEIRTYLEESLMVLKGSK